VTNTSFIQKIALIVFGLLLALIFLELGLRAAGWIYLSVRERANQASISREDTYVILCLGESTTAGGLEESYPRFLEDILNREDLGVTFSVINKGIGGITTTDILAGLARNLEQYQPRMVVAMMGINDSPETAVYEDTRSARASSFFRGFRVYKLAGLLHEHITYMLKTSSREERREEEPVSGQAAADTSLLARAEECRRREQFVEAGELYREALDLRPEDRDLLIRAAGFFQDRHQWEEAEAILSNAIDSFPDDAELHLKKSFLYRWWRRWEPAEAMARQTIELDPSFIWGYDQLAVILRSRGRFEEAERVLTSAIDRFPRQTVLLFQLLEIYQHYRRWPEAVRVCERILSVSPRNTKALSSLAFCYRRQGKSKEADECVAMVSRIQGQKPDNPTSINYRKLRDILAEREIRLVCVQYPLRPLADLQEIFADQDGIVFVDNGKIFREALEDASYEDYFWDYFAGDFGHCTRRGYLLLAENVARIISKEVFKEAGAVN
jgi:tetratricopeptide (TPR) repeat protein